jgi:hypothetical protein
MRQMPFARFRNLFNWLCAARTAAAFAEVDRFDFDEEEGELCMMRPHCQLELISFTECARRPSNAPFEITPSRSGQSFGAGPDIGKDARRDLKSGS